MGEPMFENKPRSLTLPQLREVRAIEDVNEADIALLAIAYGESRAAVGDWFSTVRASEALKVLQAAWDASNATEGAQFPAAPSDDAVAGGGAE